MNNERIEFIAKQYCYELGIDYSDISIEPYSHIVKSIFSNILPDGSYVLINSEIDTSLTSKITISSNTALLVTNPIHYRSLPEMQQMLIFSGRISILTENSGSQFIPYALHFARITQK